VFSSTRIAGSEDIQHSCVGSKGQNASSTTSSTSLNITDNSHGAAKQMRKLTPQDLKPRRANHASIHSNVPTAEANTKLT